MPTDTPGFAVSRKLDKLGNHSSDTAELSFVDVRVPVANTIGAVGRGFQQQMQQFQNERMIASYIAVGPVRRRDRAHRSTTCASGSAFGKPLIEHQWIQYRLAELAAEVELLRHVQLRPPPRLSRGEDTTRFATMAKLLAGPLVRKVADCVPAVPRRHRLHGGDVDRAASSATAGCCRSAAEPTRSCCGPSPAWRGSPPDGSPVVLSRTQGSSGQPG